MLGLGVVALAWGRPRSFGCAAEEGSTTYFFGTTGQRAAAELVDQLGPDEYYAGSKDVAWYARDQHYIDQDTLDTSRDSTADASAGNWSVTRYACWHSGVVQSI